MGHFPKNVPKKLRVFKRNCACLMTMKVMLKMNNRLHRYDINKPRLRHENKFYQIYNASQYNNGYMYYATPKQHEKLDS